MANQLKMAEVQAILSLARGGWSNRHIARQLGVHRETVARHLRLAAADSKPASAPLGSTVLATGGSEGAPLGWESQFSSKPASAPLGSVSAADAWREPIVQKLEAGLTAQRIYQDLRSDHGYSGSYYSVRRLIKKLGAGTPAPFRRMECEAGAEAQVDFGRGAPVVSADGKRKGAWVFRIVLSQHATLINITGKSYRLRQGKNKEAEGRRSTADSERLSPPEDTDAQNRPLSSEGKGKRVDVCVQA